MIDRVQRLATHPVTAQFARFGITGVALTVMSAGLYWIGAALLGIAPLVSTVVAYAIVVPIGYWVHSAWSFRGHGTRDNLWRTSFRFVAVQGVGFLINSLAVWVLTGLLGGPEWWPVIPMLVVTPLATFWLNRVWTFN